MTSGARRKAKALTAATLSAKLEPGKYHDGGGIGLYLRVDPNGARFWVQRITVNGKRREIGLGSPPLVSLAVARQKATANKQLALDGGDPLAERRKARDAMNFADAMEKYLAKKSAEFGNDKHRKQWRATLDTYAVPVLGGLSVQSIEVRPVARARTDMAGQERNRFPSARSYRGRAILGNGGRAPQGRQPCPLERQSVRTAT
jgi:hypothetical protein